MKTEGRHGIIIGLVALAVVFTYGQSLAQPLSTLAEWQQKYNYPAGWHQYPGDKIIRANAVGFVVNDMLFDVEVEVDEKHIQGKDGIERPDSPGNRLEHLVVVVLAFDAHDNALFPIFNPTTVNNSTSADGPGFRPEIGVRKTVRTTLPLKAGVQLKDVATYLVAVYEIGLNQGAWVNFSAIIAPDKIHERFRSESIRLIYKEEADEILGHGYFKYAYIQRNTEPTIKGAIVSIFNENNMPIRILCKDTRFVQPIELKSGSSNHEKIGYSGDDILNGWMATSEYKRDYLSIKINYLRKFN